MREVTFRKEVFRAAIGWLDIEAVRNRYFAIAREPVLDDVCVTAGLRPLRT